MLNGVYGSVPYDLIFESILILKMMEGGITFITIISVTMRKNFKAKSYTHKLGC